MQIQLNTDNNLTGSEALAVQLEGDVRAALDDLAEGVIRTGSDVVIVPADRMPSSPRLAAIYRL